MERELLEDLYTLFHEGLKGDYCVISVEADAALVEILRKALRREMDEGQRTD